MVRLAFQRWRPSRLAVSGRRRGEACCRAFLGRSGLRRCAPPFGGAQADAVHADARPVEPAGLAELVQQHQGEPVEHAGAGPGGEATVGGGGAATAEFPGGQQLPGRGGAGHEHHGGEAGPIRDAAPPTTVGAGRWWQQQGDAVPQGVWDEFGWRGSAYRQACRTISKTSSNPNSHRKTIQNVL